MKIYTRAQMNDQIFDRFFDSVKDDWFKCEVLQYYAEDDSPSLREFITGSKEKSLELLDEMAKDFSWSVGSENTNKVRVHVVDLPLSPYLEWEIECYKKINIPKVGEKIYLIDRKKIADLDLPDGDFHIFDNKSVIKNIYDGKGFMIHAEVYEGEEINKFLSLKMNLLERSLSLDQFLENYSK